jgi:hypothetical protein
VPFPTPAALPPELLDVLPRLAVDLVALAAVLALLTRRRRGGQDVVVACAAFNVGLFSVAQVISSADLGVGAGFGLFAVLSIIRLRSELFSNTQLAYVFSVLALALVTGIPGVPVSAGALLATLVVLTLALTDGGRAARAASCVTVTLDSVHADRTALIAEIERQLGVEVVSVTILDVDMVRETTRAEVTSRPLTSGQAQERASLRVEQL